MTQGGRPAIFTPRLSSLGVSAASFAALLQLLQTKVEPIPHPLGWATVLFTVSMIFGLGMALVYQMRLTTEDHHGQPFKYVWFIDLLGLVGCASFTCGMGSVVMQLWPTAFWVYVVAGVVAFVLVVVATPIAVHRTSPDRAKVEEITKERTERRLVD